MGRPRIPVAVKLLRGNPGGRWQDLEAGILLPPSLPEPPAHMVEEAKVVFIETGKMLLALGVMTFADVGALERYANNVLVVRRAHKDIAKHGHYFKDPKTGQVKYNPALRLLKEFEPLLMRFDNDMGLTAAARSKINLGPAAKVVDDFTAKFLT